MQLEKAAVVVGTNCTESQNLHARFIRYTADFNRQGNSRNSHIFPANRFPPHVRPAQLANLNAKITAETPDEERWKEAGILHTAPDPSQAHSENPTKIPKIRQQSHQEGWSRHRIEQNPWTTTIKPILGVIQPQSFEPSDREEDNRSQARDG